MSLRENNEGMTLMELVISMAITAIVLTMIIMMIGTAARSLRKTNEGVNLQLEAQAVMNQLNNLVMEASQIELSSTEAAPDSRYLLATPNYYYALVHRDAESKLYLIQVEVNAHTDLYDADTVIPTDEANLLAEYVDKITITPVGKQVTINLDMKMGDREYSLVKRVMMRN